MELTAFVASFPTPRPSAELRAWQAGSPSLTPLTPWALLGSSQCRGGGLVPGVETLLFVATAPDHFAFFFLIKVCWDDNC